MTEPVRTWKIQNEVIENGFFRVNLSAYESRIIHVIWRKTYGWGKLMDSISLGQFEKLTGIDRRKIQGILHRLVERKIIIKKEGYINHYGINSNCKQWELKPTGEDRCRPDRLQGVDHIVYRSVDQIGAHKEKKSYNEYSDKEKLTAFLHTVGIPLRLKEPVALFIDKVRQGNKTKRIGQRRVEGIVRELLTISSKCGEHNLITAINRTLLKEGFNWGSRNVTGYPRQIANNLYSHSKEVKDIRQSQAEKEALRKATGSKIYEDIKERINS